MRPGRGSQVLAAHRLGVNEGNATFEAIAPGPGGARRRPVVLEGDGRVLGWVAAAPVFGRGAYVGGVEHSVTVLDSLGGVGEATAEGARPASARAAVPVRLPAVV
ncbi:hypothetical protein ACFY1B_04195 [Streptomyces mirabilis]|uniref:hypothetical protein n=1 Tax=Streptomyces mirabilis TaxID=68239 RepID=UPI0036827D94